MNDHELMTLAAKAVGYEVHGDKHPPDGLNVRINGKLRTWYPLVSDGDAFRLVHRLYMEVHHGENDLGEPIITLLPPTVCFSNAPSCDAHDIGAFRLSVVRAAAAMGGEL